MTGSFGGATDEFRVLQQSLEEYGDVFAGTWSSTKDEIRAYGSPEDAIGNEQHEFLEQYKELFEFVDRTFSADKEFFDQLAKMAGTAGKQFAAQDDTVPSAPIDTPAARPGGRGSRPQ
ncbi:hypothetical protein MARA_01570 (plasmid) [Mycolicibacterium arabiense]|uniref:Uncharacterized protein n=1 Tax=Mycolicibacterium arabiense TaxID=1286181 RepID=A0A7I7RQC2_9MYCO|nr:hypothetical protein [Mycolicibacterium arabiense]MCV7376916.1 hypothetical protein [Mycolicibacterium arabiense]BBY46727.1 hypothetical protein MARA_01570 [Mycolicibacterium arabiense]